MKGLPYLHKKKVKLHQNFLEEQTVNVNIYESNNVDSRSKIRGN